MTPRLFTKEENVTKDLFNWRLEAWSLQLSTVDLDPIRIISVLESLSLWKSFERRLEI